MASSKHYRLMCSIVAVGSLLFNLTIIEAAKDVVESSAAVTKFPPSQRQKKWPQRDSIEDFLSDRRYLETLVNTTDILTKSHWKRDSSYTKSWTNEDWERHQIKSIHRYTRHIQSWFSSPTFLSVLPTILVSVLWAITCMSAVSRFRSVENFVNKAPFSTSISSFTSPISILLALKTNRALNRLFEARNMFGLFIRVSTSLSGLSVNYIYQPIDKNLGLLVGRYLAAYGWSMKGQLRGEDDSIVLETLLPSTESTWVLSQQDHPSAIVFRLRSIVADLTKRGKLPNAITKSFEDRLNELERAMGVCKRIKASPIPPTFTRMTSRVLCMFLCFLPLALVSTPGLKSPLAVLVIVTFLSYIFVGIDEISVEVENPFPLLPMFSLSSNLEQKVADQFESYQDMPKSR
ncbi:bestrophin, RFP-TM, chloride channel [Nitzschia inconspicua]|uniref:Bestrophin, RFP-TM, chloride channel n=1 Tax=Nitzschia inconspicua TaxID=303405 RepID=A0A9K3LPV7_9STRA|nr:bestrophin, RFP-TM, chloride channel [Nitzschia inconspicua]